MTARKTRRFVPTLASATLELKLSPSGFVAASSVPMQGPTNSGVNDDDNYTPDPNDFYPPPISPEPPDFDGDDVPFVLIPPVQIGPSGPAF